MLWLEQGEVEPIVSLALLQADKLPVLSAASKRLHTRRTMIVLEFDLHLCCSVLIYEPVVAF